MLKTINAVVFDMDDTLIKTFEVKLRQHKHFAKQKFGLDLDEEEFKRHWGKPFYSFLEGVYGDLGRPEEIYTEYIKLSHLFGVELQSDTLSVLDTLHAAGKKLGIVTATAYPIVMKDLSSVDFPFHKLHKLQTSDDTPVHKPDHRVFEPMLGALAQAGISDGIVYVGDALMDYYAARDAGLEFIAVTTGHINQEQFRDEGVVNITSNLSEVSKLVL